MLNIQHKSNKSGKWELQAKALASEAASVCDTLDEFIRYFTSKINEYKRDSVGKIADSYRAQKSVITGTVIVFHCPADSDPRPVSEITLKEVSNA